MTTGIEPVYCNPPRKGYRAMAWNVGYEEIHIGDHVIECQWEVDESSQVDADKSDKIPYLLVPRMEWADVPYPEIEWVVSNELSGQESIHLGECDENDEPIYVLFTYEQRNELTRTMNRASESVSMGDFR